MNAPSNQEVKKPERRNHRILLLTSAPALQEQFLTALSRDPIQVVAIDTETNAIERLTTEKYDLLIAPFKENDLNGLRLLTAIEKHLQVMPVFLYSPYSSDNSSSSIIAGAFDFLPVPFNADELRIRIDRALEFYDMRRTHDDLLQKNKELWGRAITDRLTGLYNRQYFDEVLTSAYERAKRYRNHLGCILFDIDHFKRVNDDYGHLVGDVVLREIGAIVTETLRRSDIAARYGGEEFVIILPETTREGIHLVGERLRQMVEQFAFCRKNPPSSGEMRQITISLGAAYYPSAEITSSTILVRTSDEMLYESKRNGRNRLTVSWKDGN